jgi:hypothetical protein
VAKDNDNSTEYYMALLKTNQYQLNSKVPFIHITKTNNRSKNFILGRIIVNTCLPDDYPFINEAIDKKRCSVLINDIATKYEPAIAATAISKLNKIAFDIATLNPITFTADSFNVPPELQKRAKALLNVNDPPAVFIENVRTLGKEYLDWLKVNDNGLYDMVVGSAKISIIDLGVLLFAKGPALGLDGVLSKPIMGCVNNGLDLKSFYLSADQARSGATIRAIGTAEPGMLARQVNYANCNIALVHGTDCKTKKLLDLLITPSIRKSINGRWYLNEVTGILEQITEQTNLPANIKMRSPIYCKQPDNNLCSICYGGLGEKLNTKNVGLLSGSIINKVGLIIAQLKFFEFGGTPYRTIPSQA